MRLSFAFALVTALTVAAAPLHGQSKCHTRHSIGCDFSNVYTITSTLTATDCEDDDGHFYQTYFFPGLFGERITADLKSSDFDALLRLRDPVFTVVAQNDDSGPGTTDSQLLYTLDEHSSKWSLVVTTFAPGETGDFTLSLECAGGNPPGRPDTSGRFEDPQYPDFRFRVVIGDRLGEREDDCQPDTVCVSGALPGRSELFLRILGPRPNGFLWPTLVRFTPSEVLVEIFQHSSQRTKFYRLPPVPPGTDELLGLQDRRAFVIYP